MGKQKSHGSCIHRSSTVTCNVQKRHQQFLVTCGVLLNESQTHPRVCGYVFATNPKANPHPTMILTLENFQYSQNAANSCRPCLNVTDSIAWALSSGTCDRCSCPNLWSLSTPSTLVNRSRGSDPCVTPCGVRATLLVWLLEGEASAKGEELEWKKAELTQSPLPGGQKGSHCWCALDRCRGDVQIAVCGRTADCSGSFTGGAFSTLSSSPHWAQFSLGDS
jgi:hypothetical protein